MYHQIPNSTALQGSKNCGILQPSIGEHGVSLENTEMMENMEKMKTSTR